MLTRRMRRARRISRLGFTSGAWGKMPRTSSARRELVGVIRHCKPYVGLELVAPTTRLADVLVDTGFSGSLAVPVGTFSSWQWSRSLVVATIETADMRKVDCPSAEVAV